MRIVCYINTLGGGGAERVMSVLANGLSRKGHEVTMITDYTMPNEYPLDAAVQRVVWDGEYDPDRTGEMLRTWRRVFRLHSFCKREKVDIVISFIRNASFRAILATRFLKTKNLISVRVDPRIAYQNRKIALLAKLLYPLAGGCVFQTEEAQAWFSSRIQRRSRIIFNPISDVFYNVTPAPMQEKRIVTCGRLMPQKRFDVLIDAYHKVCDDFPEYNLEIYGVGPLREELQERINDCGRQDRIKLMGRCEDVPNTIRSASLFVMSSDYEGLPNALMEAMVLGLPVVSTDCGGGGARALIENDADGLIVPPDDPDALAAAIRESLADPEAARLRGEAAGRKAAGFRTERIVALWEDYIRQIVQA